MGARRRADCDGGGSARSSGEKKRELQQVTGSSDGVNKPKWKWLRLVGEKPMGGQEGHTVHNLKRVAQPDLMETHAAAAV